MNIIYAKYSILGILVTWNLKFQTEILAQNASFLKFKGQNYDFCKISNWNFYSGYLKKNIFFAYMMNMLLELEQRLEKTLFSKKKF